MGEELPKFHETFIPILDVLSGSDAIRHMELLRRVRDEHYSNLPKEALRLELKSGGLLIFNRIGWGKSYLKEGGYVAQPSRGIVEITNKGRDALKKGVLTLQQLKADKDYIECQAGKRKADSPDEMVPTSLDSSTPQDLIDSGINALEKDAKIQLLEKFKEIDPYYFEKVILMMLQTMGYGEFEETPKSGDGGIDGIINQDQLGLEIIYIQAKRFSENKVREKDIRNFIGAMSGDTSKGIFVTTSSFDAGALSKANDAHHKIILIDGSQLVDLMYKFGIGVQTKEVYEIKVVDEEFFENS